MSKLSRRGLLKGSLAAGSMLAAKGIAGGSATANTSPRRGPLIIANSISDVTLRFIGTGVSQTEGIKEKIEEDLGFKVEMRALSTEENNQIAITQPDQYDIFDGEYFSLPLVVPSGNLRPIEIGKITAWDKIVSFFTTGEYE
ncbi:MAG: ABC transporter substrate-binding protein, partial [Cyanobacteria bacterium P01_G01_bin.4]